VSAEIKTVTDEDITLIPGAGGIFEIRQNGNLLFKKERTGGFPTEGEAAALF
jgi:predicted Rdx family selenoprotein